jgi:hypothetical protein
MELLIDERNQPLEGALIAATPLEQESGDPRVVCSNAAILSPFHSDQLLSAGSRF